jgi:hypothetical protein
MPDPARLVHRIPGRTRIRIDSRRGDAAFFAGLEQALAGRDGVRSVSVTPATGSVLICHEGSLEDLLAEAERAALFVVGEEPPPSRRVVETLVARTESLDRWLRATAPNTLDVRTAAFLGLAGLGVLQALRGQALPAGLTLLHYALEALGSAPRKP